MSRSLVLLVLVALAPASSLAHSARAIWTVDRLTCDQARRQVAQTGRYWLNTEADGPIPIDANPIPAWGQAMRCGWHQVPDVHYRDTRDRRDCPVGYTCSTRNGGNR